MFGRTPQRTVMMRQDDGSMRPVRTGPRSCDDQGHQPCPLCRYPRWYATLDQAGREAECARTDALRAETAAQAAAGTYRGQLGSVVRTITLNDEPAAPQDQDAAPTTAEHLQDLAYAACEAAAALAVAERTQRGLRSAKAAEKRTWAQLLSAFSALPA